jgi:hypothetical protein
MGEKKVAELLVNTLVSREVSRIYGVAGDSLNGITGFGIFMIKAVLSGRRDEIVDLARTNLLR